MVAKSKWIAHDAPMLLNSSPRRAGVSPGTLTFESLIKTLVASPAISLYGFYAHAGNAYASTSLDEASSFLSEEVECVNSAAEHALKITSLMGVELTSQSLVLSVGSTPTAHAASAETRAKLSSLLHGSLELHAGTLSKSRCECRKELEPSRQGITQC